MNFKKLFSIITIIGFNALSLETNLNARSYYESYDDYDDYDNGDYYDNSGYDDCYEVLKEEYVTYRGDRGDRVASGAFGGAASGALIGGIAGGGRGAGIGAGVGAGLGIIGGAASGRGKVRVLRRTCRSRDGRVFTQEQQVN